MILLGLVQSWKKRRRVAGIVTNVSLTFCWTIFLTIASTLGHDFPLGGRESEQAEGLFRRVSSRRCCSGAGNALVESVSVFDAVDYVHLEGVILFAASNCRKFLSVLRSG
ncbi:hypothetical protein HID58_007812 [Brassica napus]|uniref:Uncharacterized protein n=2 Tax=Brassica TaxID=3705 RepID=A0ABQ8EF92_BRANA|nr:hypothetical protein HID58_007812 [Brassica napus]